MGKKKHAEEHVNLERWLVSYADFITLLFATFVVLYALAQVDVSEFTKLEDSIKKAFAAPSLMQGSDSIMTSSGQSILDSTTSLQDQGIIPPILEYSSQKYEQTSFESIKKSIDDLQKTGQLQGIGTKIEDRGLVINLQDMNLFFDSSSASLNPNANKTLEKIGQLIRSKFADHLVRVEGHTDNLAIHSSIYPSNWELSAARSSSIVRFLLQNFKFKKDRFAALGYADTRPVTTNTTESGRKKNRRVEIVVLRNKFLKSEADPQDIKNMSMDEKTPKADEQQPQQIAETGYMSDAAKQLAKEAGYSSSQVIILKDAYKEKTNDVKKELDKFEEKRSHRTDTIQKELRPKESSVDKNIVKSIINNMNSTTKLLNEPHKSNSNSGKNESFLRQKEVCQLQFHTA
jgi:chemotaxis protein MotB